MNTTKEFFQEQLERVNDWLKYAEAKNALLIGFSGATLFGFLSLFKLSFCFNNILGIYQTWLLLMVALSTLINLVSFLPTL